jgi:hypothetical protein
MYIGHKNFGHHLKMGHKLLPPPNMMGHKHAVMHKRHSHHYEPTETKKEPTSDLEKHHIMVRNTLHRHM